MINQNLNKISIIVPTLNEEKNIHELVSRIDISLREHDIEYEIIFIDDHSKDQTVNEIEKLKKEFNIRVFLKKGKKGKAFSLIEGFSYANYPLVAILDADLQYPPEVIYKMIEEINEGYDFVIAQRVNTQESFMRKLAGRVFRLIFVEILHKLPFDAQAGMKVFKKEISQKIKINPTPWTFDLEFILRARDLGYKIQSVECDFEERKEGESKVNIFVSTWECGSNSIKLKFRKKNL